MTPHFFYISDITNSSSYSGKSFRKKSMLKNFRANVLKSTDLRSYNIAEDDGNSDNDADDDHHELSDVDNVDDDHNLQG